MHLRRPGEEEATALDGCAHRVASRIFATNLPHDTGDCPCLGLWVECVKGQAEAAGVMGRSSSSQSRSSDVQRNQMNAMAIQRISPPPIFMTIPAMV